MAIGYVSGLDAEAVGADPEGTAAAAVAAHTAAADPHDDREYTDAELAAAEAGLVPTTRTVTAGTGLTGGGDLSANRTLVVAYGSSAGTAAEGNDARLSDARTPTAHQHPASDVTSGTLDIARVPTGTSGSTVAVGNHTHALGTWAAIPGANYGTNMTDGASTTFYTPSARVPHTGTAELAGRIQTAVNYVANATICTLDAPYRPVKDAVIPYRSGGTGAAAGFLTIATTGVVSFSTAITVSSATAWFSFDGVTYPLTLA